MALCQTISDMIPAKITIETSCFTVDAHHDWLTSMLVMAMYHAPHCHRLSLLGTQRVTHLKIAASYTQRTSLTGTSGYAMKANCT